MYSYDFILMVINGIITFASKSVMQIDIIYKCHHVIIFHFIRSRNETTMGVLFSLARVRVSSKTNYRFIVLELELNVKIVAMYTNTSL